MIRSIENNYKIDKMLKDKTIRRRKKTHEIEKINKII